MLRQLRGMLLRNAWQVATQYSFAHVFLQGFLCTYYDIDVLLCACKQSRALVTLFFSRTHPRFNQAHLHSVLHLRDFLYSSRLFTACLTSNPRPGAACHSAGTTVQW